MTTTSAGNGPSAGDGRGDNDSGWGWFTRSRRATGTTASREKEQQDQQNQQQENEQRQPDHHNEQSGHAYRPADDGSDWPARPVNPVVDGAGAGRARWAETPEEAAMPVPAPPGPHAGDASGRGERGAAPGAWHGGGPEAPREHPAPAPYGGNGAAPQASAPQASAPQAEPRTQSRPAPQAPPAPPAAPPMPDRPPAVPPPQAERQPQPRSDKPAAAAPPAQAPGQTAAQTSGPDDAELIRRTLDEVEPRADAATAYFYALLFVQQPQLRELFPASMDSQRDRLFKALLTAVRLADEADALSEYLAGLGRGHRKYGTLPEHYPAVGECLLGALAQYAPKCWGRETEQAWVRAYTTISQVMIDAAAEDAERAPAWWNAEVVSHELRTSEIAVITLRPDQPYSFLAGQYTSVETPWWPRVWRHYSFASSPRSDGLLTFHVKAVPTGWVSSALVNRARPGDVLRLGPPAGSMTVDHGTDSGMLCVGGGTGIAPIRALVEDVVEHGRSRPVEVFYGARSDHDLYDLDTMMRLEREHRWLSVRPVVASPPGSAFANALAGQVPDAVRQYGPWSAYDGYLSGPAGMIRSGVDALVASGVPAERIRHDSLAELILSGERAPG